MRFDIGSAEFAIVDAKAHLSLDFDDRDPAMALVLAEEASLVVRAEPYLKTMSDGMPSAESN